MVVMINFENHLSTPRLSNLLKEYVKANKVDNKLITDFRKWLLVQTKELSEDEKQGQISRNWLKDMARH